MSRRQYTTDDTIQERAAQLQQLRDDDTVPDFAIALLREEYGSEGVVPAYNPVLDDMETVQGMIQLALDTSMLSGSLRTRLKSQATTLSSLSHHDGLSGEVAPTLRSLAADVQAVADGIFDSNREERLLGAILSTLDDIYTIIQTLHEANQYLVTHGLVDEQTDAP